MGWQLFPVGIGWRSFSRTVEEGEFACPNERCRSRVDGTYATYRHRSARNWATVLFVPLVPLNRDGDYVECRVCRSVLPVSVLSGGGSSRSAELSLEPSGDTEVLYDTASWAPHVYDAIVGELHRRGVRWNVEDGNIVVDKHNEALVDQLVASVTGEQPLPPPPGAS